MAGGDADASMARRTARARVGGEGEVMAAWQRGEGGGCGWDGLSGRGVCAFVHRRERVR